MAHQTGQSNERGFAMLTTMLLLMGLLAFTQVGLLRAMTEQRVTSLFVDHQQAFYLAESGVDQAVWELRHGNPPFGTWTEATAGCTQPPCRQLALGETTVLIQDSDGPLTIVQSSATVSNAAQAIELVVDRTPSSSFPYAIHTDQTIQLSGEDAIVDSYDSSAGPYAPGGTNGDIRTNSNATPAVTLGDRITVAGTITVGAGPNPPSIVINAGAGSTYLGSSQEAAIPLPPVIPPGGAPTGDLAVGSDTVTLAAGTYWYTSVTASAGGKLLTTGPVTIYVSCNLDFRGSLMAGAGNLPPNMIIRVISEEGCPAPAFGAEGSVNLETTVYAAIYAPLAKAHLEKGALYGAIVAKAFDTEIAESVPIHYDTALGGGGAGGGSSAFTIKSWRQL